MAFHTCFADLRLEDGDSPSISFQIFDDSTEHDEVNLFLEGFRVLSNQLLPSTNDRYSMYDAEYYKTFRKGKKTAARVIQLLGGSYPMSAYIPGHHTGGPSLFESKTALVGYPRPLRIGQSSANEGMCSFQKVHFHFPAAKISTYSKERSLLSTQNLHFSCPSLQMNEVLFSEKDQTAFDHVEIVSGICIFSARVIRSSVQEDGNVNVQKLFDAPPTLYEMDYIARSSSTIADIAATIILRSRFISQQNPAIRPVRCNINLDIPTSFHYYQTINELLERGSCTTRTALDWIDAVELRCQQIAEVFNKCVVRELARRGINHPYQVRVSYRTSLAASYIRESLQRGVPPLFEDVLSKFKSAESGAWQKFYSLLPMKERPRDFKALGYLLYVFEVIRSAFSGDHHIPQKDSTLGIPSNSHEQDIKNKHRHLVISIDDTAERRIYTRAQKLLKKIRTSSESGISATLVEFYMAHRIFINSNRTGSNLYLSDPNPGLQILADTGDGGCGLRGSISLNNIDVIRILYGVECAKNLQKWFAQVGL